jgi:hypothetical protein
MFLRNVAIREDGTMETAAPAVNQDGLMAAKVSAEAFWKPKSPGCQRSRGF